MVASFPNRSTWEEALFLSRALFLYVMPAVGSCRVEIRRRQMKTQGSVPRMVGAQEDRASVLADVIEPLN